MKIRPMGAEFHADRQTDGRTDRQTDKTKLTVTFRNFANAPKMQHIRHTNLQTIDLQPGMLAPFKYPYTQDSLAVYGTQKFITLFTKARHLRLC